MPNRGRRSRPAGLSVRWFVDEEGSTLLASMLAIVLAVTLLATGLQWYWVSSSSCEIQSVADLGALAGADAIAKTVTVVQVLDFVLLSMNVVAVLLHVVVIVSGVVTATAAPVGGASMAPIFKKALEFDRKFIDLRKRLANDAYLIASALSDAAPYLAMGQAYHVIERNSKVLAARVGSGFAGVAIPFPLRGEVTLSSMPANERALADLAGATSEQSEEDAERLADLELLLEAARERCWAADVFRSPSTPLYGWSPSSAISDFEDAIERLGSTAPEVELPGAIGGTSWSEDVLADRYRADYLVIGQSVLTRFSSVAANRLNGYLDPGSLSATYLLESELDRQVYVLGHEPGERKAYHETVSCSGLSNASATPEPVNLAILVGDGDHPPCSLCAPTHWSAVLEWQRSLESFLADWNEEAESIRAYEAIRQEMAELQEELSSRTGVALDEVLESVSSYLRGGRLTYRPAGSRGLVCVVTTTQTRRLPAFTLPGLTGAQGRVFGRQVAFAGAGLSEGGGTSAAAQAVQKLSTDVGTGMTNNLSGSVMLTLGLTDGVANALAPLWRSGLSMLQGGSTATKSIFNALPWGLDALVRNFVDSVVQQAGLSKPDTRQAIPVLMSVSDVGDQTSTGPEGQFARAVQSARDAYGAVGELVGATEALAAAGLELAPEASDALLAIDRPFLMGREFFVPFDIWSARDSSGASAYAAYSLRDALGLP